MFRKILGYAVLAIVAIMALRVAFALLGLVLGFVVTLLVFAAIGYGTYLVLRLISPATAASVRAFIVGRRPARPTT